jgi:hypothetical protein
MDETTVPTANTVMVKGILMMSLCCHSKHSKRCIETPKEDMDIIRARLKVAEALAKEL